MKAYFKPFLEAFNVLTKDEIELILNETVIKSFDKGTVLLHEGEISERCYLVLKGLVREYYLVDGIEKTTAFYSEGMPVNSFTSHSKREPARHYWVCAEDCILTVGADDIEKEMCKRIPRLEKIIRQEVEVNTGKAQDHFARFMTSSPEQRYLHLLETRADLLNRVPQHQIASFLGITPESLSRIRRRVVKP